jgi:arginine/lysine/ornithine decarboxylase
MKIHSAVLVLFQVAETDVWTDVANLCTFRWVVEAPKKKGSSTAFTTVVPYLAEPGWTVVTEENVQKHVNTSD